MTDQWLTAEQAAHMLNIKDPETIYRAYDEGAFGSMAIRIGRQLRINPEMFRSATEAARTAALIELADDLIARASQLKALAEEAEPPLVRKARRRSPQLNGIHAGR